MKYMNNYGCPEDQTRTQVVRGTEWIEVDPKGSSSQGQCGCSNSIRYKEHEY